MLRTLLVVLRINAIGYLIYENILRQSIKFPFYSLSHTTCMIDVYMVHVAILTRL